MQNLSMRLAHARLSSLISLMPGMPVLLAALVLLLTAGCSMTRLGYASADNFSYWWLDRFIDFTPEQEAWVREDIREFFAWHRRTQLPDYAQVMAHVETRLQQPLSAADVREEFEVIRLRLERATDYALPALARLSLSLSERQIENIERRFARNNEKLEREWLRGTLDERREVRFGNLMKHAEYWFGSFSTEQKRQLRALSDARPLDAETWLAERAQRQQALLAVLRKIHAERPEPKTAVRMLRAHVQDVLDNRSHGGNQAYLDASRQAMAELIAQVANMASPEQKEHASRKFRQLIRDSHALAGMRAPQ